MTEATGNQPRRGVKSYVLRGGRVSTGQQRALDTLYPRYCIPYQSSRLTISDLARFNINSTSNPEIVVEVGFGMGNATAEIAKSRPGTIFLGIEVFLAGVGKLLSEIDRLELKNLGIINHDAVKVLNDMIPDGWLTGIHLFFPDPWPKKKHHKRRIMQPGFADMVAAKLKKGGYIYAVTDWRAYAEHMLEVLSTTEGLENPHADNNLQGFAPPVEWRPRTKFEAKGLRKRHVISELYFTKSSGE